MKSALATSQSKWAIIVVTLLCCQFGCSTPRHERTKLPQDHPPGAQPGPHIDPSARVAGDGPSLHRSPEELALIPDAVPRDAARSRYGNPDTYSVFGQTYTVMDSAEGFTQSGYASWYGRQFHGKPTSSGTPYDMYAMTAAHREIPLPSWAEVTNLENGRSIVVKINDRGPFVDTERRIIDLSYTAAVRLDMADQGTAPVKLKVIKTPSATREVATIADSTQSEQPQRQPLSTNPMVRITTLEQMIATIAPLARPEQQTPSSYLQAGAFSSRDNAEKIQRLIQQAGAPVEIREVNRDKEVLYRVRLGPIKDFNELRQIRAELAALGIDTIPINPQREK